MQEELLEQIPKVLAYMMLHYQLCVWRRKTPTLLSHDHQTTHQLHLAVRNISWAQGKYHTFTRQGPLQPHLTQLQPFTQGQHILATMELTHSTSWSTSLQCLKFFLLIQHIPEEREGFKTNAGVILRRNKSQMTFWAFQHHIIFWSYRRPEILEPEKGSCPGTLWDHSASRFALGTLDSPFWDACFQHK